MIIYCNTNKFPALSFCGQYYKPHDARGLSKYYHFRFDPKLGMVICAIFRIPCSCVEYTLMLDKPWISGIPQYKQDIYKHLINCAYWPVLGPFNNWNIMQLSQKSTPYDMFDEIHQVVFDGIRDNMA